MELDTSGLTPLDTPPVAATPPSLDVSGLTPLESQSDEDWLKGHLRPASSIRELVSNLPQEASDVAHVLTTPSLRHKAWQALTGESEEAPSDLTRLTSGLPFDPSQGVTYPSAGKGRVQTGTEQMIRSAASLPGDVFAGKVQTPVGGGPRTLTDESGDELAQRANELAGFVTLGGRAPPRATPATAGRVSDFLRQADEVEARISGAKTKAEIDEFIRSKDAQRAAEAQATADDANRQRLLPAPETPPEAPTAAPPAPTPAPKPVSGVPLADQLRERLGLTGAPPVEEPAVAPPQAVVEPSPSLPAEVAPELPTATPDGLPAPRKPWQAKNPLSISQFIARNGGLELTGETKGRDYDKVFVPGGGPLARKSGLSIDGYWRNKLIENGYLPYDPDGYSSRDIRAELDDALHQDVSAIKGLGGERFYSENDRHRIPVKPEDGQASGIESAAKEILDAHAKEGVGRDQIDTKSLYDAAELLASGEEKDPIDALEKAYLAQDYHNETERGDTRQTSAQIASAGEQGEGSRPQESPLGGSANRPSPSEGGPAAEKALTTESTPAGTQAVIPGAEKIGQGEQAQRAADQPLKPTVAQKPLDIGMFGDESKQSDLMDLVGKPLPPQAIENIALGRSKPTTEEMSSIVSHGQLEQIVRHIVGNAVKVVFKDTIPGISAGWGGEEGLKSTSGGVYAPMRDVIEIAMADPSYPDKLQSVFHEAWHGIEDHFATPMEMALMKAEEPRLRDIVAKDWNISPERVEKIADYEIRAQAFAAYGKDRASADGLSAGIRRFFDRMMNVFRRIRNAINGLGFKTSDDLFDAAYKGEMKNRPSRKDQGYGSRMAEAAVSENFKNDPVMKEATLKEVRKQMRERAGFAAGGRVEAANINHNPSEAQKESGAYAKDHISAQGLRISVENAKGSYRRGVDKDGKPWKSKLSAHYGYIRGTTGADLDHIDCYLGPHVKSPHVYVIDQLHAGTNKFDEHKAMLFFPSKFAAINAFHEAFSDGKAGDRFGHVQEMSMDKFKEWLASNETKKPVRYKEAA